MLSTRGRGAVAAEGGGGVPSLAAAIAAVGRRPGGQGCRPLACDGWCGVVARKGSTTRVTQQGMQRAAIGWGLTAAWCSAVGFVRSQDGGGRFDVLATCRLVPGIRNMPCMLPPPAAATLPQRGYTSAAEWWRTAFSGSLLLHHDTASKPTNWRTRGMTWLPGNRPSAPAAAAISVNSETPSPSTTAGRRRCRCCSRSCSTCCCSIYCCR